MQGIRRTAIDAATVSIALGLSAAVAASAAHAGPLPTATPSPLYARAVDTFTRTVSPTPTATIPSCARASLSVNPVTSPTDLLTQNITGCRSDFFGAPGCVDITVSSEAGSFTGVSGGSCGSSSTTAFSATVALLPGQANHVEICTTSCGCPVSVCDQYDLNGDPLTIVQSLAIVDHEIGGKRVVLIDKAGDDSKRKVVAVSKDPVISYPAPGDEPITVGAELRIVRPGPGGEAATIALPAPHWVGLGNPPGSKGYAYRDRQQLSGPCKLALVKPGKVLKAACFGPGIPFDLDEDQQIEIGVSLRMGGTRHCMTFAGGAIRKDVGSGLARVGTFKAVDSAAPVACIP